MSIVQPDISILDYVASGSWTAGVPVAVGAAVVVPLKTASTGQTVACQVQGRISYTKISAQAWTQGDQVYWNGTALTNVQHGTLLAVGIAAADAANPSATGYVDLGVGIEADSDVATLRAELASTATSEGASLIGVEDAAANYSATDVEGVLAEVATSLVTLIGGDGALAGRNIDTVDVTVALGAAVGSSAADPTWVGATLLACTPTDGNDQNIASVVINGDGSTTVTTDANETDQATFLVLALLP
jgi:predicted RecA/RadA family phage recombinase